METETLVLHRFNGDEVYAVKSATLQVFPRDGAFDLFLYVNTKAKALKLLPDTKGLNARPNAEVYIEVESPDASKFVGRRFSIPKSWSDEVGDHVSCIYYCEHSDLNNNEVQILEQKEDKFLVHWTGSTTDVNHYDGSKPDTNVEIKAWFTLKPNRK